MARRKKPAPEEPIPAPIVPAAPQGGLPTSRAELRVRLQTVRNMMVGQYGVAAIVRYCVDTWGVRRSTARSYVRRVHERIAREGDLERPYQKGKLTLTTQRQLQTLLTMNDRLLQEALDPKTSNGQRKWNQIVISRNNQAFVRTATLLADLTGAREPVKVEVEFAEVRALHGVLGELSEEKLARLRSNYVRNLELAQKARVLLRLDDGSEVQDVAAPTTNR